MASYEFKNNARSTVADNPLAQSAVTLNVATGEGTNFPSSFPFKISLWDATTYPNPSDDSEMEIVKCTARTADALTIVRAQEGTADVAHALGERVAMLWTAGHFNDATTGIVTKLDTIETNAKDDQTASEVPIVDSGSIIAATDVEDALQENRIAIDLNTAKDTNVSTNLSEGTNTETTVDVNSSDGTNATLVAASTIRAGLLTKAKFDEIVANTAKTTNATHTGDVTGSVALTIAADAVTYTKMQNIVNDERIWGRVSGANGVVEELTKAQVLSMLSVEDGADVTDTTNVETAGAFMDSEFPNQSFENLLKNGGFGSWSKGAALPPDGWAYSQGGSGGSVVRVADTKIAVYIARVTKSDTTYSNLTFTVLNPQRYRDKEITFGILIKSANTVNDKINIQINDGTGHNEYYQNTGDWELITKTITVASGATAIYAKAGIATDADATVDFAGAIMVEGAVCPAFIPHPTDQIPIILSAAPTDAGTRGETRWHANTGAGGIRRMYMSNGTDWKYQAIAT